MSVSAGLHLRQEHSGNLLRDRPCAALSLDGVVCDAKLPFACQLHAVKHLVDASKHAC